ncbi:MAG: tetraacyldisaccharide 4'-kinase [Planctomycetaceae bacterium]|nr:tetraacyldisaccharide 4'-kinase [Planctomycetaceae bacterium]
MAQDAFLSLISGRRRGLMASCVRGGLFLASCGYAAAVRCRNLLFDKGIKQSHLVPVKIISVGNITTGGTGKTPVVAEITNRLTQQGVSTGILSRGYHSLESGDNDEKLVLDRLCPEVPHWLNADRVAGAVQARQEQPDLQALVLDDAFQHRRIRRDLDIVLIDATNPWGYGYQLPRGLLRESKTGLRRSDLIVITRGDLIENAELENLQAEIKSIAPVPPLIVSRFAPTGWLTLDGRILPLEEFQRRPVTACCGIGNPEGFRNTLTAVNCEVKSFVSFPDHHHYTEEDLDSLSKTVRQDETSTLVMTLKDLVKFPSEAIPDLTLAALLIEWEMIEGEHHLDQVLNETMNRD